MKLMKKLLPLAATLLSLCGFWNSAAAQEYPNKTIEVMVAFQPGGGTDSLARAYAEAAKKTCLSARGGL